MINVAFDKGIRRAALWLESSNSILRVAKYRSFLQANGEEWSEQDV